MSRFLVDEDMPRSTANALRGASYTAEDVRDVGLRGHSDADVYAHAQRTAATLITCDKGFANVVAFPVGSHAGLIVVRIPDEVAPTELNRLLLDAISQLGSVPIAGCLVIVEIGLQIRRRK